MNRRRPTRTKGLVGVVVALVSGVVLAGCPASGNDPEAAADGAVTAGEQGPSSGDGAVEEPAPADEPPPGEATGPDETPGPAPSLGASVRGEYVDVSGVGWEPDAAFVLAVCVGDIEVGDTDPSERCDRSVGDVVQADTEGEFTTTLTMIPAVAVGVVARREVVCLDEPCVVVALDVYDAVLARSSPLAWGESQLPPAPELVVRGLELDVAANTGVADVQGSGFAPGSAISLVQCPGSGDGSVESESCLYEYGVIIPVGADGAFWVQMPVYPRFQKSSGEEVDCVETPLACWISDPWPKDPANRLVSVPLVVEQG